jgi:hypothetical protein
MYLQKLTADLSVQKIRILKLVVGSIQNIAALF